MFAVVVTAPRYHHSTDGLLGYSTMITTDSQGKYAITDELHQAVAYADHLNEEYGFDYDSYFSVRRITGFDGEQFTWVDIDLRVYAPDTSKPAITDCMWF